MLVFAVHISLAILLFFLINWIGKHANDFGYASTTLFEEPTESLALNFLIRALAPSVFIVVLSAAAVTANHADLRFGIYWIVIYYYVFRAAYIFAVNMHSLVSWPRYFFHSAFGLLATWLAYQCLILPNKSLIPNLDTAGNELWLAIAAFLYAVSNKISVSDKKGLKRRNAYIKKNYQTVERLYDSVISQETSDDNLKLVSYAIIIYEHYCRPPSVRFLERFVFWKKETTTGIMQVASPTYLTDAKSVELGVKKLSSSWQAHSKKNLYNKTRQTVADYNRDDDYINKVFDIMEILAKRTSTRFLPAYNAIWDE